jgi:hypothetical protein
LLTYGLINKRIARTWAKRQQLPHNIPNDLAEFLGGFRKAVSTQPHRGRGRPDKEDVNRLISRTVALVAFVFGGSARKSASIVKTALEEFKVTLSVRSVATTYDESPEGKPFYDRLKVFHQHQPEKFWDWFRTGLHHAWGVTVCGERYIDAGEQFCGDKHLMHSRQQCSPEELIKRVSERERERERAHAKVTRELAPLRKWDSLDSLECDRFVVDIDVDAEQEL